MISDVKVNKDLRRVLIYGRDGKIMSTFDIDHFAKMEGFTNSFVVVTLGTTCFVYDFHGIEKVKFSLPPSILDFHSIEGSKIKFKIANDSKLKVYDIGEAL